MIIPESKLCPVPPIAAGRLCAGKICAWFNEDKEKCAIYLIAAEKAKASSRKKTSSEPKIPAT